MTQKDKERVIAALEEYKGDSTGLIAATVEDCQSVVREMVVEDGWISVSERLPEPGVRVLASDGGFVGEFYINGRGQWRRYNVNDASLLMALDILWWMPLPEPPRENAL